VVYRSAERADSLSVNDADGKNPASPAFIEVIVHEGSDLARGELMKVERSIDRELDRFVLDTIVIDRELDRFVLDTIVIDRVAHHHRLSRGLASLADGILQRAIVSCDAG
jgi:hypothetical protein